MYYYRLTWYPKIMNTLAINKSALRDYAIIDKFEAGIKLTGAEVKSCKNGNINLKGAYATVNVQGLPFLIGCHIGHYKPAGRGRALYDPIRSRELLLNKKEISALIGKLREKRYTLIPLSVYNKNGLIKVELGLGQGKKQFEKREAIKKRDIEREIGRRLRR